jgi:hypothetical protein
VFGEVFGRAGAGRERGEEAEQVNQEGGQIRGQEDQSRTNQERSTHRVEGKDP